jgi:predicted CoA-binding protein
MADDITTLRRILASARTIAVVGLSAEWHRPSHFAAQYMQAKGYRVIPVNPRYESILGQRCVARLEDITEPVDIVDVFRRTEDVLPIAESAIRIGARCLWQQIGVKNLEADAKARAAGLDSVMDRCVKIEHARLFGGLHWVGVNTRVVSARRAEPWAPTLTAFAAPRGGRASTERAPARSRVAGEGQRACNPAGAVGLGRPGAD